MFVMIVRPLITDLLERSGISSVKFLLVFSESSIKYMTVFCGKKTGFVNRTRGGNRETPGISRENPD
jgi:hypothetical protein